MDFRDRTLEDAIAVADFLPACFVKAGKKWATALVVIVAGGFDVVVRALDVRALRCEGLAHREWEVRVGERIFVRMYCCVFPLFGGFEEGVVASA